MMRHQGLVLWIGTIFILGSGACSDDTQPTPDARVDGRKSDTASDSQSDGAPDDSGQKSCSWQITKINDLAVAQVTQLTAADDKDAEKAGIQIDVEVQGKDVDEGEDVSLHVTDLVPDPTAKVTQGKAVFAGVTVSSNPSAIRAYSERCQEDTLTFDVVPPPACSFTAPKDGATLSKKDDKDQQNTTFDYDVKIATLNASGGQVTLKIGAAAVPGSQIPNAQGDVVFADMILPVGSGIILEGEVSVAGVKRTCKATITIDTDLPICTFQGFNPPAISTSLSKPGLGMAQDVTASAGLQTNIKIETNVDSVTLLVDNIPVSTTTASGGTAEFNDVTLNDGERKISATCANTSSGASSKTTETVVLVDSAAPDKITDLVCAVSQTNVGGQDLSLHRAGKVTCSWTAVGDAVNGTGTETVEIRYRVGSTLTAGNWDDASSVQVPDLMPFPAGTSQTVEVSGLPLGNDYYFGVRTVDYVQNAAEPAIPVSAPLALDFIKEERTLSTASGWGGIMAAGDFDCDGYTDLAVGDPSYNSNKGRVLIYLGSLKAGLGKNPIKILEGTVDGGRFGSRLAALPNFAHSATQCKDLAVYASQGDTNLGKVYVYLGRSPFPDRDDLSANSGTGLFGADLVYQLPGAAAASERIGNGLANAGDVDGDGATDLAISHDDSSADTASVIVVYGDGTLAPMIQGQAPVVKELPGSPSLTIAGGKASEGFGTSLASGSLNNDSFNDLIIGAKEAMVSGAKHGAAYIVVGAARGGTQPETLNLSDTRVTVIQGGSDSVAFGASVAFLGDMDNDTVNVFPEFAVGDPGVQAGAGAVYLFNMNALPQPATITDALATATNDVSGAASDKFGVAMACAGIVDAQSGVDFNGDGMADLLAGTESLGTTGLGAVFEIVGANPLTSLSTSTALYTFSGPAGSVQYGTVLNLAKDINGDGYADLIVGDPQANGGKGKIYLYY